MALSILAISCNKDDDDDNNANRPKNPNYEAKTLDGIVKDFKFIDGVSSNDIDPKALPVLEELVKELNEVTMYDNEPENGKSGKLGKRYLNKKGVETVQVIKKGLIGALQVYQTKVALMAGSMQAKTPEDRKAAVDKIVKYLLGSQTQKSKDEFKAEGNAFGKYMVSTAGKAMFKDIDKSIYSLIKMAYANTNDKDKFNSALGSINAKVNMVIAARTVHYIAGYTDKIRTDFSADNVHELSEGLGFAYALSFAFSVKTHKPYLSASDAKKITEVNLWEVAKTKKGESLLEKKAEEIAKMFGFKVADAL